MKLQRLLVALTVVENWRVRGERRISHQSELEEAIRLAVERGRP